MAKIDRIPASKERRAQQALSQYWYERRRELTNEQRRVRRAQQALAEYWERQGMGIRQAQRYYGSLDEQKPANG